MIALNKIREIIGKQKNTFYKKYHIKYLAIFGSVSRGDNTTSSDLDILVDFTEPVGIEFINLADELEKIFKCKVDLVSRNAIKSKYFEQIKNDLVYVY